MLLARPQSLKPIARIYWALLLVCALLVTQWHLNQHVVEHSASAIAATQANATQTATSWDNASDDSEGACLLCLEHQAHGGGLASQALNIAAHSIPFFSATPLAPNMPWLAPERARQRAPPIAP